MPRRRGEFAFCTDLIARSFLVASSPLLGPRSTDYGRLDGGLVPWHALHADGLAAVIAGASVDPRISPCCSPVLGFLRCCNVALIMSCDWIVAVRVDSKDWRTFARKCTCRARTAAAQRRCSGGGGLLEADVLMLAV